MLEINVVFMCLHFIMILYAYTVQMKLETANLNHHTANLLFIIVALYPFKYLFAFIYWWRYSDTGVTNLGVWVVSLIIDAIITSLFVYLFACLSSGWSIFRRKLPVLNRLRAAFFVTTFLTLSFSSGPPHPLLSLLFHTHIHAHAPACPSYFLCIYSFLFFSYLGITRCRGGHQTIIILHPPIGHRHAVLISSCRGAI